MDPGRGTDQDFVAAVHGPIQVGEPQDPVADPGAAGGLDLRQTALREPGIRVGGSQDRGEIQVHEKMTGADRGKIVFFPVLIQVAEGHLIHGVGRSVAGNGDGMVPCIADGVEREESVVIVGQGVVVHQVDPLVSARGRDPASGKRTAGQDPSADVQEGHLSEEAAAGGDGLERLSDRVQVRGVQDLDGGHVGGCGHQQLLGAIPIQVEQVQRQGEGSAIVGILGRACGKIRAVAVDEPVQTAEEDHRIRADPAPGKAPTGGLGGALIRHPEEGRGDGRIRFDRGAEGALSRQGGGGRGKNGAGEEKKKERAQGHGQPPEFVVASNEGL